MSYATLNPVTTILAEPKNPYHTDSSETERWVEVLVDCPGVPGLFSYRLPSDLTVKPGDILSVPFGAQQVGAIAIKITHLPPPDLQPSQIKAVEDVVTAGFFPETYWQLLNKIAEYYYTPLIQVIKVALPPGLLGRSQRRIRLKSENLPTGVEAFLSPVAKQVLALLQGQPQGNYSQQYIEQKVKGAKKGLRELLRRHWVESYLEPPKIQQPKLQKAVTLVVSNFENDLTERQREILEVLARRGGELWMTELLQICRASSSTLKILEQKGYIIIQDREVLRTEFAPELSRDFAKSLTAAQTESLHTINQLTGFAQVLLHGVTGSGKTEVYLQAIAPILAQGKSALVLVPEIGLTPQLTDRFRARFGNKVCVYHSALSDGERFDTWRQMLLGEPQVVIGTRSAVFAPLPKLGLIVLDEEHDDSFKQDAPIPTYHARQVAQWRAELENCPLILGSATPALETWLQTNGEQKSNNIYYLSLPERIQSRPMPPIEVVDMRLELQAGNRSIFSRSLQQALETLQEQKKQGILFIHRRGHSTFVSCRSCGYVVECPNCDVSLAYHHTHEGAAELLRCHYCNFVRVHPHSCPECSSPYLKFFGSGTQRVVQELAKQFPDLRVIRFDSDTTRTKGAHRALLSRFALGEADLLVGTQMLTKGLDLPQVTLVGVVAADGLLNLADYRASERAFQTLTQVAGRAGRGEDPGRVIMQTYSPAHAVIQAVQQQDYAGFTATELEQRQALNYPPYGRLLLLRLSGKTSGEVAETAEMLAAGLRSAEAEYEVLGPVPANIERVANRFRWQILVKFLPSQVVDLPDLGEMRSLCPTNVSLTWDVDPLYLM